MKGPNAAKGPDVHVGPRGTTDRDGAIETRHPSRARGINEPNLISGHLVILDYFVSIFGLHISKIVLPLMLESSMFYTCAFTSSHIMKNPSGSNRGSRCSQRPRSPCWCHWDDRPSWSRRDEGPPAEPEGSSCIIFALEICISASSPHIFFCLFWHLIYVYFLILSFLASSLPHIGMI